MTVEIGQEWDYLDISESAGWTAEENQALAENQW